jgi:hypothetical protein
MKKYSIYLSLILFACLVAFSRSPEREHADAFIEQYNSVFRIAEKVFNLPIASNDEIGPSLRKEYVGKNRPEVHAYLRTLREGKGYEIAINSTTDSDRIDIIVPGSEGKCTGRTQMIYKDDKVVNSTFVIIMVPQASTDEQPLGCVDNYCPSKEPTSEKRSESKP